MKNYLNLTHHPTHHPSWNENEIFSLRIRIKLITSSTLENNLIEILEKLSFIKKKKNWAAYFFRTMIKINKEDYFVIKNSMRKKYHVYVTLNVIIYLKV